MKLKPLIYGVLFLVTTVASSFTVTRMMEKNIAYVDINKLYNDFEMKKELESKITLVQNGRQKFLDSLEMELDLFSKKIGAEKIRDENVLYEFESRKNNYLLKKKQMEEDTYSMQQDYSGKIMKQLNSYVQDYGNENNIDMILGAEGSGALMHAKGDYNITGKVLDYINRKYKGTIK